MWCWRSAGDSLSHQPALISPPHSWPLIHVFDGLGGNKIRAQSLSLKPAGLQEVCRGGDGGGERDQLVTQSDCSRESMSGSVQPTQY